MVQGGLLTAHPGGDHGDGGQSSLRQVVGTCSFGDLEIGIAAATEQWTKSRKGAILQGLLNEG